jgi:hypothetical protein
MFTFHSGNGSLIRYVYYATVTHMDPSALMAVKWFTVINIALSNLIGSPVQVRTNYLIH